ncbi:MAG: hypothetical protein WC830_19105 [Burkholderiales bacterium]
MKLEAELESDIPSGSTVGLFDLKQGKTSKMLRGLQRMLGALLPKKKTSAGKAFGPVTPDAPRVFFFGRDGAALAQAALASAVRSLPCAMCFSSPLKKRPARKFA